ncbi:MAG: phosphoenolpyruvate--protein phosphotransferase [Gammaproteobacteria bacterium]
MSTLILTAPVAGWLMPLDEVPDPAFAGRMLGDGAAIDPTESTLCAPCDGVVTMLAETRHALTLKSDSGIDVLLHVGIDTVRLAGEGLLAHTRRGASVRRGEPLLEMDLDRLAQEAASLITPIVVTDSHRFSIAHLKSAGRIAVSDPILEVVAAETGPTGPKEARSRPDATGRVTVRLEHGFHARPAARLARSSRRFRSRVFLSVRGVEAEAGSTVGLMALGVSRGETVELAGFGADAESAVHALIAEIESGLGETPVPLPTRASGPGPADAAAGIVRELSGTVASRGVAIGVARHFETPQIAVPETGAGVERERAALDAARAAVKERLDSAAGAVQAGGDMLGAQSEFLNDPALIEPAYAAVAEGKSAGFAWRTAVSSARERLLATGDARLAERVADLKDVEVQVLESLTGRKPEAPPLPDAAIVLATELLPSQLGRLDLAKVAGFCSAAGGPTSHVALLAASLGIPAIVGAGSGVHAIPNGARVLLDAEAGRLCVEPGEEAIAKSERRIAERRSRRDRFLEQAARDCHTADGCRIEVFANLASAAEAGHAVRLGAEGCGLLRTEFLFQHRTAAPTAEEQASEYQAIADALSPRPLVIRLLDAGGDKPIPYLPLPREENPLLGLRGLRVSLKYPELLRDQLTAILRTEAGSGCRILLPMVTEPGDVRRVREMIVDIARDRAGGHVAIGAMIETPASVALASAIARETDFLSIGSNDLAQYTLAIDRAHPELGRAFDSLHPAVLRQIAAVVDAAGGCSVSVCGALASDPDAVPLLIGLGIRTLSAVPNVIPELKALLGSLSLAECRELAAATLSEEDAAGVRRVVEDAAFARRLT